MILKIREIPKPQALMFTITRHYRKSIPRLTSLFLGLFIDSTLVGVMSLGWGVRPLHTIRKLFPSCTTKDYFEIGRLCMLEEMPKNSESFFIARCIEYIKENFPEKRILFSWADGLLGKPGFIYQSSNFLYGGYSWTDAYFSDGGECIHPRTSNKVGGRLGIQDQENIKHFWGKQFRYVYFLCSHKERKELLQESPIEWSKQYPKTSDLEWKTSRDGKRVSCQAPFYNKSCNQFSDNARSNLSFIQNRSLLNFIQAEKDSGENRQLSMLKGAVQFRLSALQ